MTLHRGEQIFGIDLRSTDLQISMLAREVLWWSGRCPIGGGL
jgi:hypothetical protein